MRKRPPVAMYHKLRTLHRWIGLLSALVLLIISVTGFLLATKGTFGWIRPPEKDGQPVDSLSEVVSVEQAAEAASPPETCEVTWLRGNRFERMIFTYGGMRSFSRST